MSSSLRSQVDEDILVISLGNAKIVDMLLIEQLHRDLIDLLTRTDRSCVLIDFRDVVFMSSAAIGMLVRAYKKCKELQRTLVLCSLTADLQQVFKVTGLDKVFAICTDAAAGREFLRKARVAS